MNAIILAAGTSSRFIPLSYEKPKGLLTVRGEILIERQLRQLREAGIDDIIVVVGYKAEQFRYLVEKFDVRIVLNDDFARYNNTSSMIRVLDRLEDTFICCSDIYYSANVFLEPSTDSYYSAEYVGGKTSEYCMFTGEDGYIDQVTIGGCDAWYMTGHAFFRRSFSETFRKILRFEYQFPETKQMYWEDVIIKHLKELPLKIRKYPEGTVQEFDSLEELRSFDSKYIDDSGSAVLKRICAELGCQERDITHIERLSNESSRSGFSFSIAGKNDSPSFIFDRLTNSIIETI